MAYDIRLMKLVTGELVIGKYDQEKDCLNDVAAIQSIPTQQGVQMMIMPYGYPFDSAFDGSIAFSHILFEYKSCPEELKTKYMEACSNLTLSSGGLNLKGPGPSGLIR